MTDVKTDEKVEEKTDGKKEEIKEVLPSMFAKVGEEIHIKGELIYIKETGEIHSVVKADTVEKNKLDFLGLRPIEFVFTRPDYDDILTYRSRCSVANGTTGTMIVDPNKLRYFLVLKHLKSWDLQDDKGEVIKLEFDDNETMTAKSVKIVYGVNPKILDGIFALLENEITI